MPCPLVTSEQHPWRTRRALFRPASRIGCGSGSLSWCSIAPFPARHPRNVSRLTRRFGMRRCAIFGRGYRTSATPVAGETDRSVRSGAVGSTRCRSDVRPRGRRRALLGQRRAIDRLVENNAATITVATNSRLSSTYAGVADVPGRPAMSRTGPSGPPGTTAVASRRTPCPRIPHGDVPLRKRGNTALAAPRSSKPAELAAYMSPARRDASGWSRRTAPRRASTEARHNPPFATPQDLSSYPPGGGLLAGFEDRG